MDVADDIASFPPTQMIVATHDPTGLAHSAAIATDMLRGKGVPVQVCRFKSTHGFVAYPPQLQRWVFGIDVEATQTAANNAVLGWLSNLP